MRVLFVTPTPLDPPEGGRAMLARLHRDQLDVLLGDGLATHRLAPRRADIGAAFTGQIDGADRAGAVAVIGALDAHQTDTLWLDGSNLGRLAQAVRRARPAVRVIVFFHNVEARFFWGAARSRPGARALAVLMANYLAERAAVSAGDTLVCLSERDATGLRRIYGRGADVIAPMALDDRARGVPSAPAPGERHLLFVGGGFYANVAGIRWFAETIAARSALPVRVVGRGMEALAPVLADHPNIALVGAVDDLAPCYAGATAVIAPILDGSGMKTKVAEALMFGKHVVGTPEAFSGYAEDVVRANARCGDADAFVAAIGAIDAAPPPPFDPAMRTLYERDHSPAEAKARLARILGLTASSAVA